MLCRILAALALLGASPLIAQQSISPQLSPLDPAGTGGVQVVDRALAKLSVHRRVLVVGAHPDDEDTTLLSLVGSGLGGEGAYLSLSRGEGGQNLIGPELGLGLGLIRTGELLAARQLEGTRQYFTRAYDFGYTRSLEETFIRWPRAVLLEDAVRAVRRFKPQVIVGVFPGDSRAGHGQHQAAGVIAEEVFGQAGLPDRFPELTAEGLPPWQPKVLYRRAWQGREESTLEFDLGYVDPLTGKSVLQLAGASRSMHRSQDMGRLQDLGRQQGGLIWVAGDTSPDTDEIFGGVNTELAAIADLLGTGPLHEEVRSRLSEIALLARHERDRLAPSRLSAAIPSLAQIVVSLGELIDKVSEAGRFPYRIVVLDLLTEKLEIASRALLAAAGVAIDAATDQETVVLGGVLPITATVWNSGEQRAEVVDVEVVCTGVWTSTRGEAMPVEEGSDLQRWRFEVSVPATGHPSMPYFLEHPLEGDLYSWKDAPGVDLGEPLQRAPAIAKFRLTIAGATLEVEREVVFRQGSQSEGEVRRPVRAVPAIEVSVQPGMLLWPESSQGSPEIEVLVRSNVEEPIRGRIELRRSSQRPAGQVMELRIDEPRGQQIERFRAQPPVGGRRGRVGVSAVAVLEDGREFAASYPVIQYPHIRPMTLPTEASVQIQRLDLELPQVERIGYIRGASDKVPEILSEIGLPIELLGTSALRSADLTAYDAIVIGSRAYEADPVLAEVSSRLIDYVRQGGLLLVQYQQYQFARGGFAPAKLEIGWPHGRVTDETAPVRILEPEHPVFLSPNTITERDWQGWVQERGLYFAAEWDPIYVPLLSLHDEGRDEEKGALLVAELGEGVYIYTGLSFFRQLPAGVPGAIRLFVNLLSREES
jgi:LmbE family N-acetylglucosaminyl deacetylase